jgi:hypothetical protein
MDGRHTFRLLSLSSTCGPPHLLEVHVSFFGALWLNSKSLDPLSHQSLTSHDGPVYWSTSPSCPAYAIKVGHANVFLRVLLPYPVPALPRVPLFQPTPSTSVTRVLVKQSLNRLSLFPTAATRLATRRPYPSTFPDLNQSTPDQLGSDLEVNRVPTEPKPIRSTRPVTL